MSRTFPAWLKGVHNFLDAPAVKSFPFGVGFVANVLDAALDSVDVYLKSTAASETPAAMVTGRSSLPVGSPPPSDVLISGRPSLRQADWRAGSHIVSVPVEMLDKVADRGPVAQQAFLAFIRDGELTTNEAKFLKTLDYLNTSLENPKADSATHQREQTRK